MFIYSERITSNPGLATQNSSTHVRTPVIRLVNFTLNAAQSTVRSRIPGLQNQKYRL